MALNLSALAKIASGPAFDALAQKTGVPASTFKTAADITSKARKGDKKSIKKVKAIAAKAKTGDPRAKKAAAILSASNKVVKANEAKIGPMADVGPGLHRQGIAAQASRVRIG